MGYFIYTNLVSSLLDPRLVDPGSTLIQVGVYRGNCFNLEISIVL